MTAERSSPSKTGKFILPIKLKRKKKDEKKIFKKMDEK